MTTRTTLLEYLQELVGKRCERAENPIGSILLLDIGPLGRGPHQEPESVPSGWRSLTIESPWRLQDEEKVLCDWNARSGVAGEILNAIRGLVGHSVVRVHTSPPAWDLQIWWSNGMSLVVFSDSNEDRQDAWSILGTDGITITAGPRQGDVPGWSVQWAE
jgi:hypothetical protein